MAQTIEIVTFKFKAGTTREEFIAKNKDVENNVIMKMPGIISRETGISDDNEVVVVLHWQSAADAQNSMDKFVGNPQTEAFRNILDMSTFTMTRYTKS